MILEKLQVPLELSKKAFDVGIAGAIAGVAALAGAVAGLVKITFDWANDMDALGDVMGGTNSEMAAMAFVARKAGVDVTKLVSANTIMEKGLVKANGELDTIGKSLQEYGIDVKDANGKVKDQVKLTDEVAKKYASLSTQQERVNFLTEIYGRSGAELIDVFDTLNSEGGISAVEDKVKRLGLAIDPDRYEQFNRNLEELKLIGTGLAVQFTEKIMPAFEGTLDWITRLATVPLDEKLSVLSEPFKKLFNFTDWFKKATEEVDWQGISQNLASKINNIDWALLGQYIYQGVSNILQGIWTVVSEIDWAALLDALGNAVKELIAGMSGYASWDDFTATFEQAWFIVKYKFNQWTDGLKQKWSETVTNIINKVIDMRNRLAEILNYIPGVNFDIIPNMPTTSASGRASGGNVIAGQAYNVAEFNRPEVFIPQQNGRVENVKPAQMVDEGKLARAIAKELSKTMMPLIQLARA